MNLSTGHRPPRVRDIGPPLKGGKFGTSDTQPIDSPYRLFSGSCQPLAVDKRSAARCGASNAHADGAALSRAAGQRRPPLYGVAMARQGSGFARPSVRAGPPFEQRSSSVPVDRSSRRPSGIAHHYHQNKETIMLGLNLAQLRMLKITFKYFSSSAAFCAVFMATYVFLIFGMATVFAAQPIAAPDLKNTMIVAVCAALTISVLAAGKVFSVIFRKLGRTELASAQTLIILPLKGPHEIPASPSKNLEA